MQEIKTSCWQKFTRTIM